MPPVEWRTDDGTVYAFSVDLDHAFWCGWVVEPGRLGVARMMDPNPDWHREQAAECEQQSNWFAAAFHLLRLAALEPTAAAVKARLAAAEKKLQTREVAPSPRQLKP